MLGAGQSFYWQSALFWRPGYLCCDIHHVSCLAVWIAERHTFVLMFFFAGSRCFPLQYALLKIPKTSRHTEGQMVVALLLMREDKFHPEPHALFVLLLFVTCCLPRPDLLSTESANVKKTCTAWSWQPTSWRLHAITVQPQVCKETDKNKCVGRRCLSS